MPEGVCTTRFTVTLKAARTGPADSDWDCGVRQRRRRLPRQCRHRGSDRTRWQVTLPLGSRTACTKSSPPLAIPRAKCVCTRE
jgi:hypothetical protein